jgi:hypothetical protein
LTILFGVENLANEIVGGGSYPVGVKGKPKSEEHKRKIAEAHKGKPKQYTTYWKGKKIPKEIRKKISIALADNFSKNGHPCKGRKQTEETRRKISESKKGKKGRKLSDEDIALIFFRSSTA